MKGQDSLVRRATTTMTGIATARPLKTHDATVAPTAGSYISIFSIPLTGKETFLVSDSARFVA